MKDKTTTERQLNQIKEKELGRVLWKDLYIEQWKIPSPLFAWHRGYVCVFVFREC